MSLRSEPAGAAVFVGDGQERWARRPCSGHCPRATPDRFVLKGHDAREETVAVQAKRTARRRVVDGPGEGPGHGRAAGGRQRPAEIRLDGQPIGRSPLGARPGRG
ncbi:MAG: hypothetical protein R3F43_01895 [bacterium]